MPRKRTNNPFFLSASLIVSLITIGAITLYTLIVISPIVSVPHISVSATPEALHGTTRIAGSAERVSRLTVNGLEVPVSEDGSFALERAFPLGYTEVVVHAEDRFGREREARLTVITNPL